MLSGMLALLYWDFGKCSIRYQDYFFGQTWVRTSEDQIYYKLLKFLFMALFFLRRARAMMMTMMIIYSLFLEIFPCLLHCLVFASFTHTACTVHPFSSQLMQFNWLWIHCFTVALHLLGHIASNQLQSNLTVVPGSRRRAKGRELNNLSRWT